MLSCLKNDRMFCKGGDGRRIVAFTSVKTVKNTPFLSKTKGKVFYFQEKGLEKLEGVCYTISTINVDGKDAVKRSKK